MSTTDLASALYAVLDQRDRLAVQAASAEDIQELKAQLRERDGRILVLMKRLHELNPPPVPNAPTLSVEDVEASPGQRAVDVPITLSEPTDHTIAIKWGTSNGAGTYQAHYKPTSGWLLFQPSESRKMVRVDLLKDLTSDQNIRVSITDVLNNPATLRKRSTGLISGGNSALSRVAPADAIVLPAKPTGKTLTWSIDFADPAFCFSDTGAAPDGKPCWQARPRHGISQDGNKEIGLYASPDRFPGVNMAGTDADGKRYIQAEHHPEGFKDAAGKPILHAWDQKPFVYSAAMLQSSRLPIMIGEGSYVEARLRIDVVQGTWPAFWLMPDGGSWPPEIDIFEGFFGRGKLATDVLMTTVHWNSPAGKHLTYGTDVPLGTLLPGFDLREWHTYGILIEDDWLTYYVDSVPTVRMPNPTPQGARWYVLFDVAVGGFVGEPPADAKLPARMGLDWLKVWN